MPENGLQLMSVSDILQLAAGSVDIDNKNGEIDWWGILSAKVSAGKFDSIVDEIATNGFGMPIVLCDRYYNGEYVIGNGHHRLCAAILLGLWRIPVIVSEGSDRDDYMQKNDSMDDYGRPIDYAGTYEYWTMLKENMESGEWNVAGDESEHEQFYCEHCYEYYNNSTHCCSDCHNNAEHPRCSICDEHNCESDHFCDECGMLAVSIEDHAAPCREREYELIYHWADDCANHYRFDRCELCDGKMRDEADDEHAQYLADIANLVRVGAMLPDGVWHPAGVLADAYEEDAQWEADAPIREAHRYWESRIKVMREAVIAGYYGDEYLSICAADVAEAWQAWQAL